MTIDVRQEDIDQAYELNPGLPSTYWFGRDPVSLAAKRAGLEQALLGFVSLAYGPYPGRKLVRVPKECLQFVEDWAWKKSAAPFSFEVQL